MTFHEFEKYAAETLKKAGITEYRADALELLLAYKNWSKTAYLMNRDRELPAEDCCALSEMLEKRAGRMPLQRITGKAWFYGRPFSVADVLIPRLDTEILVSEVLKDVPGKDVSVLDLCTGSGCIAVTLKLSGGYRFVAASDISAAALTTARRNAEALSAEVCFIESSLFEHIPGMFDVIVSNPPYISEAEMETLDPEVSAYEPRLALYGGRDGLDFYREIALESKAHLTGRGKLFLEIGAYQAADVEKILASEGFLNVRTVRDLAGLDRVVCAEAGRDIS